MKLVSQLFEIEFEIGDRLIALSLSFASAFETMRSSWRGTSVRGASVGSARDR